MAAGVETSVFIRTEGDNSYPRASISARPLLRSSASSGSTTKSISSMFCNNTVKKIFCLTIFLLLAIAIAVIIIITVTNAPSAGQDDTTCQKRDRDVIETHTTQAHSGCSTKLDTVLNCDTTKERTWLIVDKDSSGYPSFKNVLPSNREDNFQSVVVSPLFRSKTETCAIHVSVNLPTNLPYDVYVESHTIKSRVILNMTTDQCRYGVITEPSVLEHLNFYRVVILSESLLTSDDVLHGLVTSETCGTFQDISIEPKAETRFPTFSTVNLGTRNLCSLEIIDKKYVKCDWMRVLHLGNDQFDRLQTHDCIGKGVSNRPRDGFVWFLALTPNHPVSEAYLISPIIEGGSSHLILSFFYMPRCNETTIRAYIIPSYRNIDTVQLENESIIYEKHENSSVTNWKFVYEPIEIPTTYKSFQVLIQGSCKDTTCVAKTQKCKTHSCGSSFDAVLAFDDLSVESRFDQCTVDSNTAVNIDCSFQDANQSATICSWKSTSAPAFPFITDPFSLLHWKPMDTIESGLESAHGATTEHLAGRGHILHFDATGRVLTPNFFRSPVVIGNSNCSCLMGFEFLLRGRLAPRVQVNLVIGEDETQDDRPVIPQWSLYGHQSEDWEQAEILLNIRTVPFQIEIRMLDGRDSRGDVEIDDLFFSNCDFRLFEAPSK